jgi:tetratricopeptide (TPR) repeat protein
LYLAPLARLDEAIAQVEQAGELDPQALSQYVDLGWLYYLQRQYPRAIWEYREALVIDPTFYPAHFRLAQIYFVERNYGAAARELAEGVRMTTGPRPARLLLSVYSRSGFPGLQKLLSQNATREWEAGKPGTATALDVALQAVWAGNSDLARRALRRAIEQREPGAVYFATDPAWDSLRSNPFFSGPQLKADPLGK